MWQCATGKDGVAEIWDRRNSWALLIPLGDWLCSGGVGSLPHEGYWFYQGLPRGLSQSLYPSVITPQSGVVWEEQRGVYQETKNYTTRLIHSGDCSHGPESRSDRENFN